MARLLAALRLLSPAIVASLRTWAASADQRDPRITPAHLDKLGAPAGGAAMRYRDVVTCRDGIVYFKESCHPFDKNGRPARLPLARWQAWAAKAQIEFRAPLETRVPGLSGYWLHDEILEAAALAAH